MYMATGGLNQAQSGDTQLIRISEKQYKRTLADQLRCDKHAPQADHLVCISQVRPNGLSV